jgi:hypothetical protein
MIPIKASPVRSLSCPLCVSLISSALCALRGVIFSSCIFCRVRGIFFCCIFTRGLVQGLQRIWDGHHVIVRIVLVIVVRVVGCVVVRVVGCVVVRVVGCVVVILVVQSRYCISKSCRLAGVFRTSQSSSFLSHDNSPLLGYINK